MIDQRLDLVECKDNVAIDAGGRREFAKGSFPESDREVSVVKRQREQLASKANRLVEWERIRKPG